VEEVDEAAARIPRLASPSPLTKDSLTASSTTCRLVVDDDSRLGVMSATLLRKSRSRSSSISLLLALGHVEPAADDVADVAGLVAAAAPSTSDHHLLAAPVDERVLPGVPGRAPDFSKSPRTASRSLGG
jgi:hypothetical protein